MAVTAVIGTGATLALSGLTLPILEITGPDISRGAINASKMTTTTWHEFLPTSLKDPGVISTKVEWEGTIPTFNAAATVTLTLSNSTARTVSGFLTKFTASTPLEDKMTADVEIQCTGAWA